MTMTISDHVVTVSSVEVRLRRMRCVALHCGTARTACGVNGPQLCVKESVIYYG